MAIENVQRFTSISTLINNSEWVQRLSGPSPSPRWADLSGRSEQNSQPHSRSLPLALGQTLYPLPQGRQHLFTYNDLSAQYESCSTRIAEQFLLQFTLFRLFFLILIPLNFSRHSECTMATAFEWPFPKSSLASSSSRPSTTSGSTTPRYDHYFLFPTHH